MFVKTFAGALVVTGLGLALAFGYGGGTGLAVAAILGVLEVSVSFDNAVVNATYLRRLSPRWQRLFLTVGVLIAVFGMRLLFPLVIVSLTAHVSPAQALRLALDGGGVEQAGSYANLLHEAHPAIAAFGGIFLLLLFCDFVFGERDRVWLTWLERPLLRIGKLDEVGVLVAVVVLLVVTETLTPADKTTTVLLSGLFGVLTFLLVNGLNELFDSGEHRPGAVHLVGRAAFTVFLYLEVLDATFSFDGVIGAFAITSDPVIIAIGLGIGAMYIRSLTLFLVRKGTLESYVYLEHGALWAIGALAVLLLLTIRFDVPELVTGLIGAGFIGAALASSISRNRRKHAEAAQYARERAELDS